MILQGSNSGSFVELFMELEEEIRWLVRAMAKGQLRGD